MTPVETEEERQATPNEPPARRTGPSRPRALSGEGTTMHDPASVEITYFTPERLARTPCVGLRIVQEWHSLVRGLLAWPRFVPLASDAGAWCPAPLEGGRADGEPGRASLVVVEVNECTAGALEHNADVLSEHAGVIVPAFDATPAQPKHRIVFRASRAMDPEEYAWVWWRVATSLRRGGIRVDPSERDPKHLYSPAVAVSPSAWLGAHILTGVPLPVDAAIASAKEEARRREELAKLPSSNAVHEQKGHAA